MGGCFSFICYCAWKSMRVSVSMLNGSTKVLSVHGSDTMLQLQERIYEAFGVAL